MNKYGYKVCYGNHTDRYRFKTYTHQQAVEAIKHFKKYEANSRPVRIVPIKKSEYRAGIWREVPF